MGSKNNNSNKSTSTNSVSSTTNSYSDFLNPKDSTTASNKINMQDVDLTKINGNLATSSIAHINGIDAWGPYIGKCPKCGSTNIEANYGLILTSYPPQYNCRCKDCKHSFFSGQTNQESQTITPYLPDPGLPKNPGWVPYNPDPNPVSPDYGYGNRQGWICPRCGKVNSPDRDFCDCSSNGYRQDIVYCGISPSTINTNKFESISVSSVNNYINKDKCTDIKCDDCDIAKNKKEELLKDCDSVFDAVSDYDNFIEKCKQENNK